MSQTNSESDASSLSEWTLMNKNEGERSSSSSTEYVKFDDDESVSYINKCRSMWHNDDEEFNVELEDDAFSRIDNIDDVLTLSVDVDDVVEDECLSEVFDNSFSEAPSTSKQYISYDDSSVEEVKSIDRNDSGSDFERISRNSTDSDYQIFPRDDDGGDRLGDRHGPPFYNLYNEHFSSANSTDPSNRRPFRLGYPVLHYESNPHLFLQNAMHRVLDDEEDFEELDSADIDDRCESDISGTADDDSSLSDISNFVYDVGELQMIPGRPQYRHRPNQHLDALLNCLCVTCFLIGIGVGIGHYIGTSKENMIRGKYINRLHALQDEYLTCLKDQDYLNSSLEEKLYTNEQHFKLKHEFDELKALYLQEKNRNLATNVEIDNNELIHQSLQNLQLDFEKVLKDKQVLMNSFENCQHKSFETKEELDQWQSTFLKMILDKDRIESELQSHQMVNMELQKNNINHVKQIEELKTSLYSIKSKTSVERNSHLEEETKKISKINSLEERLSNLQLLNEFNNVSFQEEIKDLSHENHKLNSTLLQVNDSLNTNKVSLLMCKTRLNDVMVERDDLMCEIGKMRYTYAGQFINHNDLDSNISRDFVESENIQKTDGNYSQNLKTSLPPSEDFQKGHETNNIWQILFIKQLIDSNSETINLEKNKYMEFLPGIFASVFNIIPDILLTNKKQIDFDEAFNDDTMMKKVIASSDEFLKELIYEMKSIPQISSHLQKDLKLVFSKPEFKTLMQMIDSIFEHFFQKFKDQIKLPITSDVENMNLSWNNFVNIVKNVSSSDHLKVYINKTKIAVSDLNEKIKEAWKEVNLLTYEVNFNSEKKVLLNKPKSDIIDKIANELSDLGKGAISQLSKFTDKIEKLIRSTSKDRNKQEENVEYNESASVVTNEPHIDESQNVEKVIDNQLNLHYEFDFNFEEDFTWKNNKDWYKHKKKLHKIHDRIQRMNDAELAAMDDDDIDDIYDDIEDFQDDVEVYNVPSKLYNWLSCQARWWKGRLQRKKRNENLLFTCNHQLMHWQLKVMCQENTHGNGKIIKLCSQVIPLYKKNCIKSHRDCIPDVIYEKDHKSNVKKDQIFKNNQKVDKRDEKSKKRKSMKQPINSKHGNSAEKVKEDKDDDIFSNDADWYIRKMRYHANAIEDASWYHNRMQEREDKRHDSLWYVNQIFSKSDNEVWTNHFSKNMFHKGR